VSVAQDWVRCRAWIEEALAISGMYDIKDVEAAIEDGTMHFWPGESCAAVTEFAIFPNGKALNVFAGGGETGPALIELTEMMEPALVAWARASDCRWILGFGRKGWERVCARMGYRHLWSVMVKHTD
jgi:hypothetical protein